MTCRPGSSVARSRFARKSKARANAGCKWRYRSRCANESRIMALPTAVDRAKAPANRALSRDPASGLDLDELHVEHQHPLRRTGPPAVRQLLRDPQPPRFPFDHQLHALGPAGDHLIQPERNRLVASDRTVEHLAVGGPAAVVHLHARAGTRVAGAGSRRHHSGGQAAGGFRGVSRRGGDIGRSRNGLGHRSSSSLIIVLLVAGAEDSADRDALTVRGAPSPSALSAWWRAARR